MRTRKVLYADKGKVLTNGEIYGTRIYLAEGQSADDFHEISTEEYVAKMESLAAERREKWGETNEGDFV